MDIPIYEGNELTQEYKRKQTIKQIKATVSHIAAASWSFARWLVIDPWTAVGREIGHQMKLELIDMVYHSNLHAQYKAGVRTQAILRTKRQFGL